MHRNALYKTALHGGWQWMVLCAPASYNTRRHANFSANTDIEVILGRHEPCLADRHRFYSEAVARDAGRFAEMQSSTKRSFEEEFEASFTAAAVAREE